MWKSDNKNLNLLTDSISEILRNEKNKDWVNYIDIDNNLNKIWNKTNHIIFWRRWAWKSTLIFEWEKTLNNNKLNTSIWIDCEEYKNHSFPKVIVEILLIILKRIDELKWVSLLMWIKYYFSKEKKKLKEVIMQLDEIFINDLDIEENSIENTRSDQVEMSSKANNIAWKLKIKEKDNISYKENKDYLKRLNLLIPRIKEPISNSLKIKWYDYIYLFLDDFYHLPLNKQAEILDMIHRLSKNINISYKITTIKHRALLYRPTWEKYYWVQEWQDYESIDLDKTFERFSDTKTFLENLFNSILKDNNIKNIKDIFAWEAFDYLVLWSWWVPRDFLSLFLKTVNQKGDEWKINLRNVKEAAATSLSWKKEEFQSDLKWNDSLFNLFENIENFCLKDKKRTVFAISDNDKKLHEDINKLVDFKLFHTVLRNVSHTKKQWDKYTYYMLDLWIYSKRATTKKFDWKWIYEVNVMEKNEKKRLDNIRTAPIFTFE